MVNGVSQFTIGSCTAGATVEVTMDYGDEIPADASYWKAGDPWREMSTSISGSTVTFSLTDGGEFDDDGTANGVIVDPSGIAVPVSAAIPPPPPEVVPVLPPFLLALMSLGMALLGGLASRRR